MELRPKLSEAFESLVDPTSANPAEAKAQLCPPRAQQVAKPEPFKSAVLKTTANLSATLSFSHKSTSVDSFLVELAFGTSSIFLKHGRARKAGELDGIKVAYTKEWARYLLYRGNGGADLVFIVPSVDGCQTQGLFVCPRTLTTAGMTKPIAYTPSSMIVEGVAESEGLYAVDLGQRAAVEAWVQATDGIPEPSEWKASDSGTSALASVKVRVPASPTEPLTIDFPHLPYTVGLQSNVRLRSPKGEFWSTGRRVTWNVIETSVRTQRKVKVDGGNLFLSPGPCFLVYRHAEQVDL
jgi:hypothetical protein